MWINSRLFSSTSAIVLVAGPLSEVNKSRQVVQVSEKYIVWAAVGKSTERNKYMERPKN